MTKKQEAPTAADYDRLDRLMKTKTPLEDLATEFHYLGQKFGGEKLLLNACQNLRTDIAHHLISVAGADCHQAAFYHAGNGAVREGSLVDVSLAAARDLGMKSPDLIELLSSRGVLAAEDCNDPIVMRYRNLHSPRASFDQASERVDYKEAFAKAGTFMFRQIMALSPFAAKNDLKIN